MYVSGDYAYVADGEYVEEKPSGLQVIDISDPTSPAPVGSYDTSDYAEAVYVSGDYAYVADWHSGLQVIDISDPTSPTRAGAYNSSGVASAVSVSGDYAYVAGYTYGLQVIDINSPVTNISVVNSNTIMATFPADLPEGPYHVLVTNPGGQSEEGYLYNGFRVGQNDCPADGDVNDDDSITPQDALMCFQHYLEIVALDECQQVRCDVCPPGGDGSVTPADALGIFRNYLELPSCLD